MLYEQVGQLKIVRQLGAGGMGAVYLGVHGVLGVKRAIKFLLPQLTQSPPIVQRFFNEARAAGKLEHRNILQVHDVGQLPNGMYYIVFDYVEGQTLASFIWQHNAPVAPSQILRIVCQIANALRVAHSQGIIHRDLKPENVLLTSRDGNDCHVVIIDWGIVLLINDPEAGPQTKSGTLLGTPAYMSPEQIRAGRVAWPADVYALATMVYRLATGGWFPYQFADESLEDYYKLTPTEICFRQTARPAPDPRERVPHLDEAFALAILTGLEADPDRRPTPQQYALMLADAAPRDNLLPGELAGLDVIYEHARELLDTHTIAGVRASRPPTSAPIVRSPLPKARSVSLESRYEIKEKLGQGGMAEVFLATAIGAQGFAKTVAIKRVLPGFSEQPAFAELFTSEATIAARLNHPNITAVLDFDRDSEGRLFLVMEYVNGKDLARLLDWGSLPPSLIIFITSEMLRGLGYAHSIVDPATNLRGVIHRDMSPQNLILSYEGAVKVADFGLAKALQGSDPEHSGTVRGKPRYMSPEQVNAEPLDNRSDLFAVGVMLWEMLAHRSLFRGILKEVMGQVLFYDIPRPSTYRKGIPSDVEAIAMKLLKRNREERYQTAEEAIVDLVRCRAAPRDGRTELEREMIKRFGRPGERAPGKPRKAVQIEAQRPPTTFGVSVAESTPTHLPSRRRRRAIALAATAIAAVAIAIVAIVAWNGDETPVAVAVETPILAPVGAPTIDAPAPPVDAAASAALVPVPVDAAISDVPKVSAPDAALAQKDAKESNAPTRLNILAPGFVEIFVDGKSVGTSPAFLKVAPGKHTVSFTIDGKTTTRTVNVRPNRLTRLGPTW